MTFWFIISGLILSAGGVLGLTLLRGRVGDAPPAAYDLQVYRDQLKEVERDLARGIIGKNDAERVRIEVSRRVLAADAKLREHDETGGQSSGASWVMAALMVAGLAGGSAALYMRLGVPGYPDLPLEARIAASDEERVSRLDQDQAEAKFPAPNFAAQASPEFLELMDQLRKTIEARPEDLRGLQLLARNEARLGNLTAAHAAQARIITVKGSEATAQDYARLAELMIGAVKGYVSKDAEAALSKALRLNPSEPTARYYRGLYLLQVDRPDAAFHIWETLLRESRPDAPWVAPIRDHLEEVAKRAGVNYELPPLETPGPSVDDIEAASAMSDAERQEMIRGMVARLSERLATEGGSADEWARLISAQGVLGETEQARRIWVEAQQVFAGNETALSTLNAAANSAGLTE